MSLSRPIKFPLLKLPWLCIKCVLHNTDEFVLIYFASISNRTRRIVKSSDYSLKVIDLNLNSCEDISFGISLGKSENQKTWYFAKSKIEDGAPLVLRKNSEPICTSSGFDSCYEHYLHSYTLYTPDAFKMAIGFLVDVFGCEIRQVFVDDKLSEFSGLGISSVEELFMNSNESVNTTDLKYLLENVKVTDQYVFDVRIPEDFHCDAQIFKSRSLSFISPNSADWVTLDILCQFDVPQMTFFYHRFSVENIVSYITHWFNSENRKLEHVQFNFKNPSLEDFKIEHLNPMLFCETRRNRCAFDEEWEEEDFSSGKDILRRDGLLATLHALPRCIVFYVWHKRFPDAVQQ